MLLRFQVIDTGVGIAPKTVRRLFAASGQADNFTRRRHGGTGPGRVITRRLTEPMGRSVGVESAAGAGS